MPSPYIICASFVVWGCLRNMFFFVFFRSVLYFVDRRRGALDINYIHRPSTKRGCCVHTDTFPSSIQSISQESYKERYISGASGLQGPLHELLTATINARRLPYAT